MSRIFSALILFFVGIGHAGEAAAVPGTVLGEQRISSSDGRFDGNLGDGDRFGFSAAGIGDLDGNGVGDVVVGAPLDDDGEGDDTGAVWVLFLDIDGKVEGEQKISDTAGSFGGTIDAADQFGLSVTSVGDLDGDGVVDLAVGVPFDDDGDGEDSGAVWILFLRSDGKVEDAQKISDTAGGFGGKLIAGDLFGYAVAGLGDLDGDGVGDLAVGAPLDDDGRDDAGAVWVLFLDADGKVADYQKISRKSGDFEGSLDVGDTFGTSVVSVGDLDADGATDIAVGAPLDNDGEGPDHGAVWILRLLADGRVKTEQKLSNKEGGFAGTIDRGDLFGWGVAPASDLDGDGVVDLGVGAPGDDNGGNAKGAVWMFFLQPDDTIGAELKISDKQGEFGGKLDEGDRFGHAITAVGDVNQDGVPDLVVGTPYDDDGPGQDAGAVWVLFMDGVPTTCMDADDSGAVTSVDALVALNAAVGLAACDACRCDVDGSGAVTATDALVVLNAAVALPAEKSCPRCGA